MLLVFCWYWIRQADLCLCLGTSLQIFPCASLPLMTRKSGGRVVLVNLQATPLDSRADLVIHDKVDAVMAKVSCCLTLRLRSHGHEYEYESGFPFMARRSFTRTSGAFTVTCTSTQLNACRPTLPSSPYLRGGQALTPAQHWGRISSAQCASPNVTTRLQVAAMKL